MKTCGISPKILIPALAQVVGAVVFLILGDLVEGKTLIAAAVGTFVVGYGAAPGSVVVDDSKIDPAAGDVQPPDAA